MSMVVRSVCLCVSYTEFKCGQVILASVPDLQRVLGVLAVWWGEFQQAGQASFMSHGQKQIVTQPQQQTQCQRFLLIHGDPETTSASEHMLHEIISSADLNKYASLNEKMTEKKWAKKSKYSWKDRLKTVDSAQKNSRKQLKNIYTAACNIFFVGVRDQ